MIAGIDSEDRLVAKTTDDPVHGCLKWACRYACNAEPFGAAGVSVAQAQSHRGLRNMGMACAAVGLVVYGHRSGM